MTAGAWFAAAVLLLACAGFAFGSRIHRRNWRRAIREIAGWKPWRDYSAERGDK